MKISVSSKGKGAPLSFGSLLSKRLARTGLHTFKGFSKFDIACTVIIDGGARKCGW